MYILYSVILVIGGVICKTLFVPKHCEHHTETETVKIRRLYTSIRDIEERKNIHRVSKICNSIYRTAVTIMALKYRHFLAYLFGPQKLNDNTIAVWYYNGHSWYRAIISHRKKLHPRTVFKVTNHGKDITTKIIPYMGPNEDWYGHSITPAMLGYDSLTFFFTSNEIYTKDITFESDNAISPNSFV